MKKTNYFLLIAAILFSQIIFSQETEIRELESFSKLYVSGTIDAIVQQGNEESIKIVAKGIVTRRVITETSDNDLHIYIEDGDYKNINVKVFVTYKDLKSIDRGGSSNLEWLSDFSGDNFDFSSSGSGNCNFKNKIKTKIFTLIKTGSGVVKISSLETGEANLTVSGSGDVNTGDGYATKQNIQLSGSANVLSAGLKSEDCRASVTGSGSIEVSASKTLEAVISGSGNLIYNGNPQLTKKAVTGSGKLAKKS